MAPASALAGGAVRRRRWPVALSGVGVGRRRCPALALAGGAARASPDPALRALGGGVRGCPCAPPAPGALVGRPGVCSVVRFLVPNSLAGVGALLRPAAGIAISMEDRDPCAIAGAVAP